jgi:proline dehydrogenase
MIDAEESWIQKTIDHLAINMMRFFNKEEAIVYNTYQMYRHDKLASLITDFTVAEDEGFILGSKNCSRSLYGKRTETRRRTQLPIAHTAG